MEDSAASSATQNTPDVSKGAASVPSAAALAGFGDISLEISAVLGTTSMPIQQFLKLSRGSVITLDQGRDDPVRLLANGALVAECDITVVEDHVGVSIRNAVAKR